jgi:hypothetical protein
MASLIIGKVMEKDFAIKWLNESGKLTQKHKLISDFLELVVIEFLRSSFKWTWIIVQQTSEYDDIKAWMDAILIWKNNLFVWIDITLWVNDDRLKGKERRGYSEQPKEFLATVWNKKYNVSKNNFYIWNQSEEQIKRIVLELEPQLIQMLWISFIDRISDHDDPKEVWINEIKEVWEEIKPDYLAWKLYKYKEKWVYLW